MLRLASVVVAAFVLAPFLPFATAGGVSKPPTIEDDLAALAADFDALTGQRESTLQLPMKKGKARALQLTFYREDKQPGQIHFTVLLRDKDVPKAAVVAKWKIEEKGKKRFIVATYGEGKRKEVVRIPYTRKEGKLELGDAVWKIETLGEFALKGKWQRLKK
jgi:hypothetical protein